MPLIFADHLGLDPRELHHYDLGHAGLKYRSPTFCDHSLGRDFYEPDLSSPELSLWAFGQLTLPRGPFLLLCGADLMKPRLADLLVCPQCSASLQLEIQDKNDGEIITGSFLCPDCCRKFPIREGIPRFVPSDVYAASFSFEWKRWQRTQFDTESRRITESTFIVSTGRQPHELAGKLALDVGCGTGRFMDLLARTGAEIVGIDLSLAIEVAAKNLQSSPNCHFVQADALTPPFRPGPLISPSALVSFITPPIPDAPSCAWWRR